MKGNRMMEIMFYGKTYDTFMSIDSKTSMSMIARKTDVTYAYTNELIHIFSLYELVSLQKVNGRKWNVCLTNKGTELRYNLLKMKEIIENGYNKPNLQTRS